MVPALQACAGVRSPHTEGIWQMMMMMMVMTFPGLIMCKAIF